jgi:flagellar biosynthesis GTPase FlhF
MLQGAFGRPAKSGEAASRAGPAESEVLRGLVPTAAAEPSTVSDETQDRARARDLVSLIRDEIGELRREVRLARQVDLWQSAQGVCESVRPIVDAIGEAGIPAALRGLLVDQVRELESPVDALRVLEQTLRDALGKRPSARPLEGIHLLAGPAGAGKSLMAARLAAAHASSGAFGPDGVALVSYCDDRAGAWAQMQVLAARVGVDSFRAGNSSVLSCLLDELADRRLILIDTAAPKSIESVQALQQLRPDARMHLVLPLDVSPAQVHRQVRANGVQWHDLMISRMDEPGNPWPLLQVLCEGSLHASFGGFGTGLEDLIEAADADLLIDRALETLQPALGTERSGDCE